MVRTKKSFLSSIFSNQKFLTLVGFFIIVLISIPLAKNISQRYKINKEIRELQEEIANLENKNIDLKELVAYLESDQFVEEQARLNLGLKKPGEDVAVIKNNTEQEKIQKEIASSTIFNIQGLKKIEPEKPTNNFTRWIKYFFK